MRNPTNHFGPNSEHIFLPLRIIIVLCYNPTPSNLKINTLLILNLVTPPPHSSTSQQYHTPKYIKICVLPTRSQNCAFNANVIHKADSHTVPVAHLTFDMMFADLYSHYYTCRCANWHHVTIQLNTTSHVLKKTTDLCTVGFLCSFQMTSDVFPLAFSCTMRVSVC